jgi:hypothetical protein
VAPAPGASRGLLVAEIKWRRLSSTERANVRRQLQSKWSRCQLAKQFSSVRFEVLDAGVLAQENP